MHIYLLNQYFPPDVAPTGRVLRDLASRLVQAGHQVTVFCSPGEHLPSEEAFTLPDGIEVRTVWALSCGRRFLFQRLLRFGSFYVALFCQLLIARPRPDVIVSLTTPPYLGFLAHLVARVRGARSVDWIMDLYPDVMLAHGMVGHDSPVYQLLKGIKGYYLGRSALVITLGPDMARRAAHHHGAKVSSVWVPLWATPTPRPQPGEIAAYREKRGWRSESTVFLYSGNLGLGHRFSEFLRVIAERGADEPRRAHWAFYGQGGRREEVEQFVGAHLDLPIEIGSYVSEQILGIHLAAGDVHLASMDPTWDGCMVPSKFQGSFSAGRPVLFLGSASNSLAAWLQESGGGWVIEPNDHEALHAAVEEALDRGERRRRGELAAAFARERFDREANTQRMVEAIERIR